MTVPEQAVAAALRKQFDSRLRGPEGGVLFFENELPSIAREIIAALPLVGVERTREHELIAQRLASRHLVEGETFFAMSPPERDFIIAALRSPAALPKSQLRVEREDVAQRNYLIAEVDVLDTIIADDRHSAELIGIRLTNVWPQLKSAIESVLAPPHTGQPIAEECARAVENMTWHGAEGVHALTEAAKTIRALKHTGQPQEGETAVRNFVAQLIVDDNGGPTVTLREQMIPTSVFAALLDVVVPRSAAPASPHEVHERDTPVVKPIGQTASDDDPR